MTAVTEWKCMQIANIQKWCWLLQNYIVEMPLSDKSQGVYCPRRLSQGLYPARSWWGKKQESFVSENSTGCSSAALTVRHCWPWELISDNRYGHTHTHTGWSKATWSGPRRFRYKTSRDLLKLSIFVVNSEAWFCWLLMCMNVSYQTFNFTHETKMSISICWNCF